MSKYLKKFETQSAYDAAESSLILPNVSLTVDNNTVHYNPYVEPAPLIVTAKFNVTDTSNPTQIMSDYAYEQNSFTLIEIDGVELPSVVSAYTFSTIGEHTIKYTLSNTNIADNAFYECSGLTSIDIPSGVTSIDGEAFSWCDSLTSIIIPNSVTSIGGGAFSNCASLTSCTIGSGVKYTECCVFQSCNSLIQIVSLATTAPTLGSEVFDGLPSNGTLYVPIGSSGYDVWMQNEYGFLGYFGWTMVEQ